jgi:hypothetical protein
MLYETTQWRKSKMGYITTIDTTLVRKQDCTEFLMSYDHRRAMWMDFTPLALSSAKYTHSCPSNIAQPTPHE